MEKRTVNYDHIFLLDDNTDDKDNYTYLGLYEVKEETTWVTFDIIFINLDASCFVLYAESMDFSNNIKEAVDKGIATFNNQFYNE